MKYIDVFSILPYNKDSSKWAVMDRILLVEEEPEEIHTICEQLIFQRSFEAKLNE